MRRVRRGLGLLLVAVLALLAVLVIQALLARRGEVEPFMEAPRTPRFFGDDGSTLSYVVLGDSTGAGQGADYEDGIAVRTARYLARSDGGRRVRLVNLSVSGAQLSDVVEEQLPLAVRAQPDVVLLSAGANDVTGLTSTGDVRRALERIGEALPDAEIVLTASPDVGASPRIDPPLQWVVDLRRRQLNDVFREVAADRGWTIAPIAAVTGPQFRADRSLFSPDRYHPDARGYATWLPPLTDALDRAVG